MAACLLLVIIFGGMLLTQGRRSTFAAGTKADPIRITEEGFIIESGEFCSTAKGSYWHFNIDGSYGYGCVSPVSLANKYVEMVPATAGTNITVVLWGKQTMAGLTLKKGVTVTHAPLIYFYYPGQNDFGDVSMKNYPTMYTPGYRVIGGEQDFSPTGAMTDIGASKKVDIEISDFLRIEDGAKIDVTGRGFPGGNGNGHTQDRWLNTSNTGNGQMYNYSNIFSGGMFSSMLASCEPWFVGGAGGAGGAGTSNLAGAGGEGSYFYKVDAQGCWYSGDNGGQRSSNTNYGGGGGAAGTYSGYVDRGGSGGGYVNIKIASTGKMQLFGDSKIVADGESGDPIPGSSANNWAGGGGGGGVINIDAKIIEVPSAIYNNSLLQPSASGAKWPTDSNVADNGLFTNTGRPGLYGNDGVVLGAISHLGSGISANGGLGSYSSNTNCGGKHCAAGGGGGGTVTMRTDLNVRRMCEFSSSNKLDYLPSYCENSDVVIDGITINADTIRLDKTTKLMCSTDQDIIGAWHMNEASGAYVGDTSGNALDGISEYIGPNIDTSGHSGAARSFNGTQNYVSLPTSPLYDTQSLTINTWIKLNDATKSGVIFQAGVNGPAAAYTLFHASGDLTFRTVNSAGVLDELVVSATSRTTYIYDNSWHMITAVYNPQTQQKLLYVDGILKDSKDYSETLKTMGETVARIGATSYATPSTLFKGSIDEVSLWRKAMSGSEVAGIYNADYTTQNTTDSNCDSKRTLNSLTIKNGGKLTHRPINIADLLLNGGDSRTLADALLASGAGRWHKVDVTTSKDLTLVGTVTKSGVVYGSSIDVSGMGYRGGVKKTGGVGYGLGGGAGDFVAGNKFNSVGGGYGGIGGRPTTVPATGYGGAIYPLTFDPTVYDYDKTISEDSRTLPLFDFGSGGGNADAVNGGNGGGRIHLKVLGKLVMDSTANISANGSASAGLASAGSGGMVWLDVTTYSFTPAANFAPGPSIDGGIGSVAGQSGYAFTDFLVPANTISAKGGSATVSYPNGGGGGGRVVVKLSRKGVSEPIILKTIKPIERDGITVNENDCTDANSSLEGSTCFNPYAAKEGDIVEVALNFDGLSSDSGEASTLEDTFLKIAGSTQYCDPTGLPIDGGAITPTVGTPEKITWLIDAGTTSGVKTYQCQFK